MFLNIFEIVYKNDFEVFDLGFADSPHADLMSVNRTWSVSGHQERARGQSLTHLGV